MAKPKAVTRQPPTIDAIIAEVERRLPDNDQGLITAADVRALLILILTAIKEGVDS
jgi:hypothetical protein